MLEHIIRWSLSNRLLVILLSALVIVAGAAAVAHLPIDAFPDTTPVQVQVNTSAPAYSPEEIEAQVTYPIEQALAGLPNLLEVRSISKFGLSQVTALFTDDANIYLARQVVSERLQTVDLPSGITRPELGPVSTGLGEIYHYLVRGEGRTLEELTTIQDWVIKPRLKSITGVAEVNTWGGERKQYHVLFDPDRLLKFDMLLDDLVDALQRNNLNVAGGILTQAGELHLVRGIGLTSTVEQIGDIVIRAHDGVPVRVRDVATVAIDHEIRRGAATANGRGETVLGLVFMLMGENSYDVTRRVANEVDAINRSLPGGVQIVPVYVRTELVQHVIDTVRTNLLEAALLVIAVLFAFLGNLRAGLIVAAAIPLSMLFAACGMLRFGIAASLMSLGALDFGLIVDSGVIMVENSLRRLSENHAGRPRMEVVCDAALEVRRPTMFGELIIAIVYLPILTLEGMEGRLFRPMAITVILALLGSMVLSLTLMPVLASLMLPHRPKHRDTWLVCILRSFYAPVVEAAVRWRGAVIVAATVMLGIGAWSASRLGAEFLPRLSEEAVTINAIRLAGVSLEESVRYSGQIEKLIRERFSNEVRDVWTRTGTAEVATDPMGIELSDLFLTLHPRPQWRRAKTQEELESQLSSELSVLPGMRLVFSQPIEMRVNEMIAGVRSDLAVKVFGDDLDTLRDLAGKVRTVMAGMPASADLSVEQITGQPALEVVIDQAAIARFGVPAQHALEMVEAVGGRKVGEIREDPRRFDLVLRLMPEARRGVEDLSKIRIASATGERIPLTRLASIRHVEGPSTITREWQKRRIVVQANVSGDDLAGYVAEAKRKIARDVALPEGYYIRYGGQFEHFERASTRLMIVVPIALGLVFVLLHMTYGRLSDVLRIFLTLPLAAVGGLLALQFRGLPFSVSAGVGLIAMSGVAVLGDMVFVSHLRRLLGQGLEPLTAIRQTALTRLRPVLMTGLVASLGFVPMAFNTGVGAEVQRPLATVVIGAVITSTFATLLVLPAIYAMLQRPRPGPQLCDPHESVSAL